MSPFPCSCFECSTRVFICNLIQERRLLTSVCLFLQNDMTSVGLHWEELLMPLLQKYKLNITWGDQDLLNIIFHHNPGKSELRNPLKKP